MNREELFEKLKNHTWTMLSKGYQVLNMGGGNYGILSIEFKKDGSIFFPNNMLFLPNFNFWQWDEKEQKILLGKKDGSISPDIFFPPERSEGRIVLSKVDSLDIYYYFPHIEKSLKSKVANIPQIERPSNKVLSTDESTVLFENIILMNDFENVEEIEKLYYTMVENSIFESFYVFTNNDAFRFLDVQEVNKINIGVERRTKKLMYIYSSRSLLIEFFGDVLFEYENKVILSQAIKLSEFFQTVLKTKFSGRYNLQQGLETIG